MASRFGWRLYRTFFKTYTEKVWGVPGTELKADFGGAADKDPLARQGDRERPRCRTSTGTDVTSLIEEFQYPKHGPGHDVGALHASSSRSRRRRGPHDDPGRPRSTGTRAAPSPSATQDGTGESVTGASHVISSMPYSALVRAMDPPAPAEVLEAADDLHYRDFLTVALVVPEHAGFPDNWIYVHYPGVKVGRIQNFGSWSPFMVKDGRTCLGLEYFVFEGDELWDSDDADLIEMATGELTTLGLVGRADVERGFVVRMPKAYPVYDEGYQQAVETIRSWLASEVPERPRRGPQRHAQVQQPGPFDVHGHAHGGEHRRRGAPRHLGRERRRGVPRGEAARRGGRDRQDCARRSEALGRRDDPQMSS